MTILNKPYQFFERVKHDGSFCMRNMHCHDFHELYFLVNGKTKYFIGSDVYELTSNDFIFIPKGEYHQTEYVFNSNVERILICFDDDFIAQELNSQLNELFKNKLIKVSKDALPLFYSILKKIEFETNAQPKDYLFMQKIYLSQLLILLARHRISTVQKELSSVSKLIQDSAKFITTNYNENLSLEFLANHFAISAGYFSKLFKKVTGVGVSEYVNIARISVSKIMLAEHKKSVTDIAISCGFNDSNYFSQVFKKIVGISPKKYALQFV